MMPHEYYPSVKIKTPNFLSYETVNLIEFSEQKKRALEVLEKEVRPQVEYYESQKEVSTHNKNLTPTQKVHASCTHQI